MKELRITKSSPHEGARRFRGVVNGVNPDSFSGALDLGFSAWICGRWGLADASLITPARKSFLTRRKASDDLSLPRERGVTLSENNLFITLNLAMALAVDARATLSTAAPRSSALTLPQSRRELERAGRVRPHLASAVGSLRLLSERISEIGRITSNRILSLLSGRASAPLAITLAPRAGRDGTSAETRTTLLSTEQTHTRRATEGWVRLLREKLSASAHWHDRSVATVVTRAAPLVIRHLTEGAAGTARHTLMIRNGSNEERPNEPVAHRQWSLVHKTVLKLQLDLSSRVDSSSALNLFLAAPKPADAQAQTGQAPRFSSSPSLRYAKREAHPDRELLTALRELRQQVGEMKSPAPVQTPQIDVLTRQVYDQIKRELRIEKERRGL